MSRCRAQKTRSSSFEGARYGKWERDAERRNTPPSRIFRQSRFWFRSCPAVANTYSISCTLRSFLRTPIDCAKFRHSTWFIQQLTQAAVLSASSVTNHTDLANRSFYICTFIRVRCTTSTHASISYLRIPNSSIPSKARTSATFSEPTNGWLRDGSSSTTANPTCSARHEYRSSYGATASLLLTPGYATNSACSSKSTTYSKHVRIGRA